MRFLEFYLKESSSEFISEKLKKKFPEIKQLWLTERGNDIVLDTIIINKESRNKGIGSKILEELCEYADQNHSRILLTTGVKDDHHGTTSSNRLKKFYKRFGFVENKGRNKDFSVKYNMIRNPQL